MTPAPRNHRRARIPFLALLALLGPGVRDASAGACDRACLRGHMDRYLDALLRHDTAAVPLAPGATLIHNGAPASVDHADWKLIDGIAFRQYVIDPEAGQVALFGVANENFRRGTLYVRLAVDGGKLALIETVAGARTADGVPGLISPNPFFDYVLPESQRRSRAQLTAIADSYFEGLERHDGRDTPVTPDCRRFEDGVQTSLNPVFVTLPCNDFGPFTYIAKVDQRIYPIVDTERGLVLGQVVLKVPKVAPPPAAPPAGASPGAQPARPPVNPVSGMVLPPSEWRSKPRETLIRELFKVVDGRIAEIQTIRLDRPFGATEPAALYAPTPRSQPRFAVRLDHNVRVRMRDGVELSTDLYLPDAPGRYPTVLSRTPYNNTGADAFASGRWYAERGYAYVTQDVRGKYDSDGKYVLYAHEAQDGLDTLAWIAAQPWSDGRVGMSGGSYGGYVQLAPAVHRPPQLAALSASVTTSDIANGWTFIDGALFLSFGIGWAGVDMNGRGMQYGPGYDWPRIYRHLPLATMDEAAGQSNPGYRELLRHPRADDPFWQGISLEDEVRNISVPVLSVTGWYDIFLRGALADHVAIARDSPVELARRNKRLIVGPWTHFAGLRNANPGLPATGPQRGVDFGPAAELDLRDVQLRWQDHWLKGLDNGVEQDAPVRIFVMGENRWRDEQEWPLARTRYTKYYLHSDGGANGAAGNGRLATSAPRGAASDRYTYDPADPVPTLGGNLLDCLMCRTVQHGPVNQAAAESRQDVLVYTSDVLTQAVEVTGPLKVTLYAASSAPDTDWTAKLVDVHPDGYAQNIQDGIVRARYRRGKAAPAQLLEPGAVYEYQIDLWATSNTFLPGHRIRLDISSSNFPRFDRNLNTGEDPMSGVRMQPARQIVFHSARYPSHILLPIIPSS